MVIHLLAANDTVNCLPCPLKPGNKHCQPNQKILPMALSATVFKAELNIADMDRHYYQTHQLVMARHPSENDERMMVRLLAFTLNANESLQFTKGLSTDDEPELWQKNLSDEIELWIELGQPDEKRIRKACARSQQVIVYCYGGRASSIWWDQNAKYLKRFDNLRVINLPTESTQALASMVKRGMHLNASLQDGVVTLSDDEQSLDIAPEQWYPDSH